MWAFASSESCHGSPHIIACRTISAIYDLVTMAVASHQKSNYAHITVKNAVLFIGATDSFSVHSSEA